MAYTPGSEIRHSTSYRTFFAGYTEKKIPSPNGIGHKIQRVYTADYYRQQLSQKQVILLRIVYLLLHVGAAACILSALSQHSDFQYAWYCIIAECLMLLSAVPLTATLLLYLISHRNLTIGEYHSTSKGIRRYSTIASALSLTNVLTVLIYLFLHGARPGVSDGKALLEFLAGSLLFFLISRIEKKITYITVANTAKKPEGGSELW
ncbi:MAG: hypothetical protein LUG99_13515 [Lachnospiraceae bacterium]|nr:hypothetical protein [Lachnospiraceae bacterium]